MITVATIPAAQGVSKSLADRFMIGGAVAASASAGMPKAGIDPFHLLTRPV